MQHQIPLPENALIADRDDKRLHPVNADVHYLRAGIVNVIFVALPEISERAWVLIDAGIPGCAGSIRRAAAERFGKSPPIAIILTHAHFDHIGALRTLADGWSVPIYAHALERPFLNGSAKYPAPDPFVGGMMALSSPLLPRGPIDVSDRLIDFAPDHTLPAMPGWNWIHTPGHTPGHISLWRESDRTLIAGDAFVTTRQESVYHVISQTPEMHGPPMYFTPDWHSARESVRALAALEPERVVTGHGRAFEGPAMRAALHNLADRFDEVAVPRRGRRSRGTRDGLRSPPAKWAGETPTERQVDDALAATFPASDPVSLHSEGADPPARTAHERSESATTSMPG